MARLALCVLFACGAQPAAGRKRKGKVKATAPVVEALEHGNDLVYKPADFDPRKAAADVDPEGIIKHIVENIPNSRCAAGQSHDWERSLREAHRRSNDSGICLPPAAMGWDSTYSVGARGRERERDGARSSSNSSTTNSSSNSNAAATNFPMHFHACRAAESRARAQVCLARPANRSDRRLPD